MRAFGQRPHWLLISLAAAVLLFGMSLLSLHALGQPRALTEENTIGFSATLDRVETSATGQDLELYVREYTFALLLQANCCSEKAWSEALSLKPGEDIYFRFDNMYRHMLEESGSFSYTPFFPIVSLAAGQGEILTLEAYSDYLAVSSAPVKTALLIFSGLSLAAVAALFLLYRKECRIGHGSVPWQKAPGPEYLTATAKPDAHRAGKGGRIWLSRYCNRGAAFAAGLLLADVLFGTWELLLHGMRYTVLICTILCAICLLYYLRKALLLVRYAVKENDRLVMYGLQKRKRGSMELKSGLYYEVLPLWVGRSTAQEFVILSDQVFPSLKSSGQFILYQVCKTVDSSGTLVILPYSHPGVKELLNNAKFRCPIV